MNDLKIDLELRGLLDNLLFNLRGRLMETVGNFDLAKKKLELTNSAYSDVAEALKQAQHAQTEVWEFGQYWRQRRGGPV